MFPLRDNIPTSRPAVVTIALLLANVLVYFLWQKGGILHGPPDAETVKWGWIPYEIKHPGEQCVLVESQGAIGCGDVGGQPSFWVTAFTSMFMHGSILHLGGNMLFLWIFGDNVEDRLGHVKFLVFYLLCGFAATYAHAVASPESMLPAIGASGAISGVLGAYLFLYPGARILTLIFLGFFVTTAEIPALVYLPIWFLLQFVSGIASIGVATSAGAEPGGVAWFAHIGGFIAGPLLLWAMGGRRPRRSSRGSWA